MSTVNNSPLDFPTFLADFQARVTPLEIAVGSAYWQANVDATEEAEVQAGIAQKAITRVYAERDTYAYLKGVATDALPPDQARQHLLLVNAFMANQMDDAVIEELVDTERRVEGLYNTHRPLLRGEPIGENAIRDILRTSDDTVLRYDAWAASKEIGVLVEADVLRLVALRNAEARRLGYSDYYVMALEMQELDVDDLFRLLTELDTATAAPWAAYKAELDTQLAARYRTTPDTLRPWHYLDAFFQEAPPGEMDLDPLYAGKNLETLTDDFFHAVGFEVKDILQRSDLYEREGKCQHAFCIHVGRFDDVRVLCNCTSSERWMGTMLHEFGHAIYDKYLGDDLPYFLRDTAHTMATEAIAMLMGRLSRSEAFLHHWVGVSAEEAARVGASAAREQAVQLLVMARWCLVMTHFERALYADPGQDLNRLWWEIVQRFQGVTPPENRDAPDWAAKLHLATAPVYYQNYILGEMFASQLLDHLLEKELGDDRGSGGGEGGEAETALVSQPRVGAYLTEAIFAHGARYPWNDLITRATGESLNARHFVGHLGRI